MNRALQNLFSSLTNMSKAMGEVTDNAWFTNADVTLNVLTKANYEMVYIKPQHNDNCFPVSLCLGNGPGSQKCEVAKY